MHVIQVTDPVEARRARFAQYSGAHKTFVLNGQIVSGLVQSVAEAPLTLPAMWIISIIPSPIRQSVRPSKLKTARWQVG